MDNFYSGFEHPEWEMFLRVLYKSFKLNKIGEKIMTTLILYAILAIAAIGAFVGWSNAKKGAAWGQPMTIACAVVAIGMGFYLAYLNSFGGGATSASRNREEEYQKIMTKKLALFIKEKFSGKKAVVIIDPYLEIDNPPSLEGLKDGFGGVVEIVEVIKPDAPKRPEGDPGMNPGILEPQEKWYRAKSLDKVLTGKNFDICVTLMGLPADTRVQGNSLSIPALKNKKVFIGGGSIYNLKQAIISGAVTAAVSYKTDAIYDDKPVPSKLDEAFDKRFALITKDNVAQYKTLFR